MTPEEFRALARVEREHWFYRGKRDVVRHWVGTLAPLRPGDLLLDVGAGTGQLVAEFGASCRAVGVEPHGEGLAFASAKGVRLVQGAIEHLPVASGVAAVVTALDVLEHLDDDAAGLAEIVRVTRPGGLVLLLVPAFPLLWSDLDETLGHRRRYTRAGLRALVGRSPLAIRHCAYVNSAAFPPILLYRLARRLGLRGGRLEDGVPPAILNAALHAAFVRPARWAWFSPPFGVSILCVAEKERDPRLLGSRNRSSV
jgi:SAM-dependent methyltransferase